MPDLSQDQHPLYSALAQLTGAQRPFDAALTLAESVAADCLLCMQPPFDPAQAALCSGLFVVERPYIDQAVLISYESLLAMDRKVGIPRCHSEDSPSKGADLIIAVRSGINQYTQRFFVAHELGHFHLRKAMEKASVEIDYKRSHEEEENLANWFASGILLNRYTLIPHLRSSGHNPKALEALAKQYQVHLEPFLDHVSMLAQRRLLFGLHSKEDGVSKPYFVSPKWHSWIFGQSAVTKLIEAAFESTFCVGETIRIREKGKDEREYSFQSKELDRQGSVLTMAESARSLYVPWPKLAAMGRTST